MINSNKSIKIKEDVVITVDNIKELGEKIALWGLKVKNNLNDRRLDNLFYGLIKDVLYGLFLFSVFNILSK